MVTSLRSDTLLEVKNLSVDYFAANGTVHAVTDVNFSLRRGEVVGLAGESGSGKSTLAYAISRLHRPPAFITGGEVLYYQHKREGNTQTSFTEVRQDKPADWTSDAIEPIDILQLSSTDLQHFRWRELSIVFQSAMNALNPVMDIGAQITDVLQTHEPSMGPDARKQRAIELLRLVGIAPDRLHSYPHELSGGMRQRAIIAIALALRPEMIIMDEPTTALDVVVQREILNLISGLCKEFGMALIFITHDLSLLLELADKIAIMYAGRLVETAASGDVYRNPRHPYSYGLLNSFPTIHGPRRKMTGIPGSPPDLRNVPAGCAFHPRCPLAFDTCYTVMPTLISSSQETPQQMVACHLYDRRFRPKGSPTQAEIAAKYEALAERK